MISVAKVIKFILIYYITVVFSDIHKKEEDPKVLKCPVGTAPVVVRNRRQTEWNTGLVWIFLRREGGKPEGLIPLIGVVSGL